MNNIFVFSQNLKLESLNRHAKLLGKGNKSVFITTHYLFDNEREFISHIFDNCEFRSFSDFLTDKEMEQCDIDSYIDKNMDYQVYLSNIKKKKNQIVINKVLKEFPDSYKYIFSKDLGIDYKVWKKSGFKYLEGQYYHNEEKINAFSIIKNKLSKNTYLKKIYNNLKGKKKCIYDSKEVFVGYSNGRKYIFLGSINRIGYRLDIQFKNSIEECEKLNRGIFETYDKCTYFTTWHEHVKCRIPDNQKYAVRWAQDGYLPPNYSHKDYYFKPDNVKYYCWDILGTQLFKNQKLPYELIPFRKKLYLPKPVFPKTVRNILVVASGSGDWTALKNRSDDDIMVDAFVKMAIKYPNIHFTYRCHPTWIHPLNVGVNAINRVHDYFKWLGLPNLTLSSNIPPMHTKEGYQYSFSRTSLKEDLQNTDFVIGEHSISMIDAAFEGIPFFSVNITKRRNFFTGLNDLGFPYCSTLKEIELMINKIESDEFKTQFLNAIKNYNEMTDLEIE